MKLKYNRRPMSVIPHSFVFGSMPKAANRTVVTTFRTQPGVREALEVAAGMENRSMSNLMERLAIEHCRSKGIPIAGLEADNDTRGHRDLSGPSG
ncbi:hypothetical protein [Lysobacter capsici]|uniref:hypothetical protein n=1 Tax=Lysobacter capsici TaxID=435897 RepID=UPI001C008545|nr:hypothetical protein [Lysobacter capsici]QWF17077.1 hypothetical protein KME82_25685 [Lysobacter capsici]